MTGYVFEVIGVPQAKGSSRMVPVNGTLRITSDNRRLAAWERSVRDAAVLVALGRDDQLHAPIALAVEFRMPVPKRRERWHRGYHCVRPDVDKLVRGVCDPLSGVLYGDDSHIARVTATKRYVRDGERVGARIALAPLREEPREAP